ncbi:MAG: tRNA (N6-isopentenyl adenosine(37)-C2)-methylthiotransferase MiaB, partial [Planctomycetia bacterium]|nr:tRNA (N6-isopentenyl adenosine(37)-C2)-methylthiotransferase MiaB [Planctomycetia bacterium]
MAEQHPTTQRLIYLRSYGCQMNALDSRLVTEQLRSAGYCFTENLDEADLILLNTCSVRRHAEERVYSSLGRMKRLTRDGRGAPIIGLIGCMAEMHRFELLRRFPHISFLCGPAHLHRIPSLIAEAEQRRPCLALDPSGPRPTARALRLQDRQLDELETTCVSSSAHKAFVRAMRGCDRFCTYCVVPFVRGPERSRPPGQIVDEARRLVDNACKQITLLGQTVNSYRFSADGQTWRLADLLCKLSEIPGLTRLTFVTSHPCHFTRDLAEAMGSLDPVMPYLHLPAQSGSDTILKRMNRGYTSAEYAERVAMAREHVPGLAVASDFIVGFPGETEEDFEATCDLCRRMRFSGGFVFKYSPRPKTAAAKRWTDDVPDKIKRQRNNRLLSLLQEIATEDNQDRL